MDSVAPHAGAGIETIAHFFSPSDLHVAPHAGAWIETVPLCSRSRYVMVAPHAGAWIETKITPNVSLKINGRAPRGRVD